MPLEIGKEYPPDGEEEVLKQLAEISTQVHYQSPGPNRRGQHPKNHGCVWAHFIVGSEAPEHLRAGIFGIPGRHKALVRFSNGRFPDDQEADVRGMAIKVFVPTQDSNTATLDFVLADHPVFFARDARHMLDFLLATVRDHVDPKQLAVTTHPALVGFRRRVTKSLLRMEFWSQTPFQLGKIAAKYVALPCTTDEETLDTNDPDFLRRAMVKQLSERKDEACFDLCVNAQSDPISMPVEDATAVWNSAPVPLAKVVIYPQVFTSLTQMTFCENLTFAPARTLSENRPLGGINRARRRIYEDSSLLRHTTNQVPVAEPTGLEYF